MKWFNVAIIIMLVSLLSTTGCQEQEHSKLEKTNAEIWDEYLLAMRASDTDKMHTIVEREWDNIPRVIQGAIDLSLATQEMEAFFPEIRLGGKNSPSMTAGDLAHIAESMASIYVERSGDKELLEQAQLNRLEVEALELTKQGLEASNAGDHRLAISIWIQALEAFRITGHIQGEKWVLYNTGLRYAELEEYELATEYLHQAKEIALKQNDEKALIDIYYALGLIEHRQSNFDEADKYLRLALSTAEQAGDEEKLKWLQERLVIREEKK